MASPNEPWTLAGGKKNKPQNAHASSKGKKKAFVENMPRIEPSRKYSAICYINCKNLEFYNMDGDTVRSAI